VLFGVPDQGGFDCSGFVWRVYKRPFSGGGNLANVIQGRTTYQMSGEVPKSKRIYRRSNLLPGDVLFFGSAGANSTPSQVDHTGIYLGRGWMMHSSSQGVTLVPLAGWYTDHFAWARRPLREAGLA
jgi:cell wall-associated NlpC family hydrolase